MDRFKEISSQLHSKTFEVELQDCKVTRCSVETPEEYSGVGKIQQDDDGNLHFQMETSDNFSILLDSVGGEPAMESGKLIPLSSQFKVTGIDPDGGVWESSASLISTSLDLINETAVIKFAPKTWRLKSEADPKLIQKKWSVAGRLRPLSAGKQGTGSKEDSFEDDLWNVTTENEIDVHTFTYIAANKDELELRATLLNKGWSLLCGCPLQPFIQSSIADGVETIQITKVYPGLDRNKLTPFIDPRGGKIYDHLDFIKFWLGTPKRLQEQLVSWESYKGHKAKRGAFASPIDDIFQHFYRVQFAYGADMENAVQVLTSAIEGLISSHFKNEMDGDKAVLQPIAEAQSFIDGIKENLDVRVQSIINGALSRASAPTTKSVLLRLVEQGVISESLVKIWSKARNSPAHGTLLNHSSDVETQLHIDGFFASFEIFKRLVFCLIGYTGSHVNYEKPGWPTENWPPAS